MAPILPFRHLVVHPSLTRQWERAWPARETTGGAGSYPEPRRVHLGRHGPVDQWTGFDPATTNLLDTSTVPYDPDVHDGSGDRVRAFALAGIPQDVEHGVSHVPADLTGAHTLDLVLQRGSGHR